MGVQPSHALFRGRCWGPCGAEATWGPCRCVRDARATDCAPRSVGALQVCSRRESHGLCSQERESAAEN